MSCSTRGISHESIRDIVRETYNNFLQREHGSKMESFKYRAEIKVNSFLEFEPFPFEAGSFQLAFHGVKFKRNDRGDVERPGIRCVVKVPIFNDNFPNDLVGRYKHLKACAEKSIERYEIAHEFAIMFNELRVTKKVKINECSLAEITKDPYDGELKGSEETQVEGDKLESFRRYLNLDRILFLHSHVTVEDYLDSFEKFLNNDGRPVKDSSRNLPGAFAHWTWQKSKGKMMISDIQGQRNATSYVLSDPCIHTSSSNNKQYGGSDLGDRGIKEFFLNHQYNDLCRDLCLQNFRQDEHECYQTMSRVIPQSYISNMKLMIKKERESIAERAQQEKGVVSKKDNDDSETCHKSKKNEVSALRKNENSRIENVDAARDYSGRQNHDNVTAEIQPHSTLVESLNEDENNAYTTLSTLTIYKRNIQIK